MRIRGQWYRGGDGVTVPTLEARLTTSDGRVVGERFLIDSGADRTVFTARLVGELGIAPDPARVIPLGGVGGSQRSVPVPAAIEFRRENDTGCRSEAITPACWTRPCSSSASSAETFSTCST